MDIEEAKKLVCNSGKRLKTSGLVAGTWGNISQRVDDKTMVITPSGMDYEKATPDDMSVMDLVELTYTGPKPSTEKKLHAQIYLERNDVNSILHTHSMNASTVAAARVELKSQEGEMKDKLGDFIRVAEYAIPGTSKLVEKTQEALSGRNAALLANHGALCVGSDMDDAFNNAKILENGCKNFILSKAGGKLQSTDLDQVEIGTFSQRVSEDTMKISPKGVGYDTVKKDNMISVKIDDYLDNDSNLPTDARVHAEIYRKRKDINAILHPNSKNISIVSSDKDEIPPILDDMAQIVGPTIRIVDYPADLTSKSIKKIRKAIKGRNGVLLANDGALCIGRDLEEAFTTLTVLEKSCKAFAEAKFLGGAQKIGKIEAWVMHLYYLKKYGKK